MSGLKLDDLIKKLNPSEGLDTEYKCMHCKTHKPLREFYVTRSGRAAPFCKACNPLVTMKRYYAGKLVREGKTSIEADLAKARERVRIIEDVIKEENINA